MRLSKYLFSTTTYVDALAFYARCGFGEVVEERRYEQDGMPVASEAVRNKVMHARFEGPGVLFHASDNDDAEPMRGSAHIAMPDDRARTGELFAAFVEGGRVTTLLGIQPSGDYYGKLTDRFGVQWMLNCGADAR